MTVREQLGYWSAGLAVFIVVLWLLADALLPFVLGAAIAYLTDPIADWLEKHGLSRLLSTVVITVASIGAVVIGLLLVVPVLVGQTRQIISQMPWLVDEIGSLIALWTPEVEEEGSFVSGALANLRESAEKWSVGLLQRVWSGGLALINFVALLLVTPVVAFYLLMDWDRIVAAVDDYLPREHRETIHHLSRELDRVLSGFVRGQLSVCLILGVFYAAALMIVGLKFGLLIGIFAGLISFIPFVGSIVGGLLSVGVAAAQYWEDPVWIAVVAAIFAVGQAVEGNFLTPKLVGGKVGLHPVWLLFALSAFGVVFGFVGVLIAAPAAAVIGVLTRFFLARYKAGRLYQGSRAWQQAMAERREPEER